MANYTFTQKTPPSEPQQEDWFGAQATDGARNPIQTGAGISTSDATATPVVSPVSVSNTVVTTINIPTNAVAVTFAPTTNSINISEADPTVATKYFTVPAGSVTSPIGCTRMSVLYLKANVGAAPTSFWFTVV